MDSVFRQTEHVPSTTETQWQAPSVLDTSDSQLQAPHWNEPTDAIPQFDATDTQPQVSAKAETTDTQLQVRPALNTMDKTVNINPQASPIAPEVDSYARTQQSTLCEVRDVGGKGQGIFATRSISAGTLLIEETPLITVPTGVGMTQALLRAFLFMNLDDKKAWMSLSKRDLAAQSTDEDDESVEDDASIASSDFEATDLQVGREQELIERAEPVEQEDKVEDDDGDISATQPAEQADAVGDGVVGTLGTLSIEQNDEAGYNIFDKSIPPSVPQYGIFSNDEVKESAIDTTRDVEEGDQVAYTGPDISIPCLATKDDITFPEALVDTGSDTPLEDASPESTTVAKKYNKYVKKSERYVKYRANDIINVFETNALGCEVGDQILAALCLQAAKINHSCIPSVFCAFNTESKTHTVHTIKNIAAGEEICTSYIAGSYLTTEERQAEIQKWGFMCSCPACSGELKRSDKHRRRLWALRQKADVTREKFQSGQLSREEALQGASVLVEMINLMTKEGLVGAEMADLCGAVGMLNLRAGRGNIGLTWLSQKLPLLCCCYGEKSQVYLREVASFQNLLAMLEIQS